MKKLSVIVSLSLMLSSLSWAEKYEYVRLKGKTDGTSYTVGQTTIQTHDSFTLENGDIAEIVSQASNGGVIGQIYVESDNTLYSYDAYFGASYSFKNIIVGPCVIHLTDQPRYSDLTGGCHTWRIKKASDTGSKTLSWNGSEWEGSDDSQLADNKSNNSSPVPDPSGIKYDQLLGWCYFTDTPWIYSYTNGSWYYMHSMQNGIYVWNANLPNDGWMKLHG